MLAGLIRRESMTVVSLVKRQVMAPFALGSPAPCVKISNARTIARFADYPIFTCVLLDPLCVFVGGGVFFSDDDGDGNSAVWSTLSR